MRFFRLNFIFRYLAAGAALFLIAGAPAVLAAEIFFDPASRTVTVGSSFIVTVRADTQGRAINAVEGTVTFSPSLLRVQSVTTSSSLITIWARTPEFNNTAGTVSFRGGLPTPGFTGVGEIFRITFAARSAGSAAISVNSARLLANDGQGTNVLTGTSGAAITIQAPPPLPPPPEPEPELEPPPPSTQIPAEPPATPLPEGGTETAPSVPSGPPSGGGQAEPGAPRPIAAPRFDEVSARVDSQALESRFSALAPGQRLSTVPILLSAQGAIAPEDVGRLTALHFFIEPGARQYQIPVYSQMWSANFSGEFSPGAFRIAVQGADATGARTDFSQTREFRVFFPACADGADNDQDGGADFPADRGCGGPEDESESDQLTEVIRLIAPEEVAQKVSETIADVQQTRIYKTLDEKVINNPAVEEATVKIAAPVIVAAAAANVSAAVNIANLLAYLQLLFTQPFLIFTRRRRKEWGQVYSSLTKLPVDLAIVRLFDASAGRLMRTRVTDREGRYLFLTQPGTYRMEVAKPGFIFPSAALRGKGEDLDHANLYHGDTIAVTDRRTIIRRPIPVDPEESADTPKSVIAKRRRRAVQKTIAWSGPVFAMGAVIINPNLITVLMLALQFALLSLFKRLAEGKQPRSWATVSDATDKAPVSSAVVRIFDAQFDKLLETQITDKYGRYAFLVGRGRFYITIGKDGYKTQRSEIIDLSPGGVRQIVKRDIILERGLYEKEEGPPAAEPSTPPPAPPSAPPSPYPIPKGEGEAVEPPAFPTTSPPSPPPVSPAPPSGAIGIPTVQNPSQADKSEETEEEQKPEISAQKSESS